MYAMRYFMIIYNYQLTNRLDNDMVVVYCFFEFQLSNRLVIVIKHFILSIYFPID